MGNQDKVNILLVDDQPAKLLSLHAILEPLHENVLQASAADEALRHLLQNDIAIVLMDVCMPGTDGFELAEIIREHPRFRRTAIIFISAVHLTDADRLRGYGLGAVDYIPVPIIPEVLRAKVAVFAELHRKTEQLNAANRELERRVAERTAELEASNTLLRESREQVALELAATQRLQAISTQLILQDSGDQFYDQILDAAIAITRSDFASIQMFRTDRGRNELRLLAHRGFTPEAAEHWKWVNLDTATTCGGALRDVRRTFCNDTYSAPELAGTRDLYFFDQCGIRACQTTPLISRSGRLVGVISTHWKAPTTPAERELRLLDVLGRQAADLIERSQNEAAMRESEARFRTLADNMAQLAWMANPDGSVFWLNRRWFEFTGLSHDASINAGWTTALHPDDAPRIIAKVSECFRTGQAWEDTFLTRAADGSYRWFLTRAFPITDDTGAVTRWFGTGTDVTEQREAQQVLARDRETLEHLVIERTRELERSNERLRLSERMATIGTLAAGLGHDIGNLLLPVRLRLDSLESAPLTERAREDTAAVRKAAEYLQRLSGSLRLLALDSRGEEHNEASTDLTEWWRDAEGMLRNGVPRHVTLTSELPPRLPAIRIGRAGLTQVVFNLVQNSGDALKTRAEGRICVSAQLADQGRAVAITVTDNGPGMSEDARKRCLEPFFTTKARELSTGLGLPLVSAIIARAHGTIQVQSAPNQGASFRVEIPVAPATPAAAPARFKGKAMIALRDPRLRAHVTSTLAPLGVTVCQSPAARPDLWIADADDAPSLEELRITLALRPDLRIILFCKAAHAHIPDFPRAVTIDASARLSEIRGLLADALSRADDHAALERA